MFNKIHNMTCQEGFKLLPDQSIQAIVTSPPYAEQRISQYGGIPEKDYPQWTVDYLEKAKRIMKPNGSVFINIRTNIEDGVISDYVIKTILALRENGWKNNEELIWIKAGPPLGSCLRPRRNWESIHWFSLSRQPYVDLLANGKKSNRVGFVKAKGVGDWINGVSDGLEEGIARCTDVIDIPTSYCDRSKGNTHPAQYPAELAEWLINLSSKPGDVICDPFMGSGSTAVAAKKLNRQYVGFEINPEYIKIADARLFRTSELDKDIWDYS